MLSLLLKLAETIELAVAPDFFKFSIKAVGGWAGLRFPPPLLNLFETPIDDYIDAWLLAGPILSFLLIQNKIYKYFLTKNQKNDLQKSECKYFLI